MKYGVREVTDVVFRAKTAMKFGTQKIVPGQPVLYLDSAKTSTLEQASTSVYATGGRGNTRLVSWEGEKTLTFTVEDALISPIGLSILSGAGYLKGTNKPSGDVHVHANEYALASIDEGIIDLTDFLGGNTICADAPIFIMETEEDNSLTGKIFTGGSVLEGGKKISCPEAQGQNVMVDFYILKSSANVAEIQIKPSDFAGYYYVEASTLFRKQIDGVDAPVNITLPNVKIQSNFSFTMASSGDPSTFTFTMDAMPGYTYFDKSKKVLCVMQTIEENVEEVLGDESSVMVLGHGDVHNFADSDSADPAEATDTDAEATSPQG